MITHTTLHPTPHTTPLTLCNRSLSVAIMTHIAAELTLRPVSIPRGGAAQPVMRLRPLDPRVGVGFEMYRPETDDLVLIIHAEDWEGGDGEARMEGVGVMREEGEVTRRRVGELLRMRGKGGRGL